MTRTSLLPFVVLGAACVHGTAPRNAAVATVATPPKATPLAPEAARFTPSAPPVERYNDPASAPALDAAESQAVQRAFERAGVRGAVPDARLSAACADLAAVAPQDGMLPADVVQFAVQHYGLIEPSPKLSVGWGRLDTPEAISSTVESIAPLVERDGSVRFGIGRARRSSDGGAIVLAVVPSNIATGPLPRALPAGGTLGIAGTVAEPYRSPEIMVTRDSGAVEKIAVGARGTTGFVAEVRCGDHRGRQEIEVLGTGPRGVTVLANFPVWCGSEPPRSYALVADGDEHITDAAAAERALFALTNRDRAAAGLPPLQLDPRLTQIARRYSREMLGTNVVGHVSPISGSPSDRVRSGGVRTGVVLENIAHTYSVGEAERGLMASPGHRANILTTQATHLGVGVALGQKMGADVELFATEVFIRVPPRLPAATARAMVEKRIAQQQAGVPPATSPALAPIAEELARSLAAGQSHDAAAAAIGPKLSALSQYRRVEAELVVAVDLETLDTQKLTHAGAGIEVGVAVAQGDHPELGPDAMWVVVLTGERR